MEVKRRGRWADDRSLKRYGKETRLLHELGKIAPAVIEYGMAIEAQLLALLLGDVPIPPPPALPVPGSQRKRRR